MHSPTAAIARIGLPSANMRSEQRQFGGAQAVLGGPQLVPIGIEDGGRAYLIEARHLVLTELETEGREIVLELSFAAPADDERSDARPAEEPGAAAASSS